ncbi:sugar ABC transporter ATP-binding protein [Chelatococcus asaccharovorans]|uniref:Ribose transport system ATP-binding protein/rhamnose transport system ATP-binding protein n=1 Tax=Chelatococcus asaccharovorans TaxID=28210 RepID=A0A2V3TT67_9HYPH|nr:sugar ABC transporter ATP-binding protein [Chelatococcus asaccharovorans]MBS7704911.1 sugar ABC transporter ATP-binding protein [Chelatococcus asaccharovorans]PXW51374.1 ribose transport system ATP-binding protein/rhamnose transport system ATP-binding protein [Chelatococcus asaccharovorans]
MKHAPSADPPPILLTASKITKTFDKTRALAGADFELREGEIHGLLGANGAGKSTLSKVISGHYSADSGSIRYRGRDIQLRNTRDALRVGIAIVMQETSLVPDLSVLENIFLPELGRPGRLDYRALKERGRAILDSLGQGDSLPFDWEVRRLSSAQKQLVEIAKALGVDAKLIIFDEPTASLSPGEVDRLFDVMARLRETGHGLVFVSHRLEEVFSITDRVTVMREGRTVMNAHPTADLTQAELIRAMVGAELGAIYTEPHTPGEGEGGPVMLEVRHLVTEPVVKDVSFSVRAGEILGLGGLVGAGRSETVEAIFGLRPRSGGEVRLGGKPLKGDDPQGAIRAGLGFVAEDRRTQNIVPDLSVKENLLLAHLGAHRGFFCGYQARERKVKELLQRLGLPEDRLMDASMLNFSGGMQQKIIMARWLLLEPKVLILDEPTKGVDIGTRASIYAMLRDIVAAGVAVVVVSSDFEELLGISDRIVVMSDGRSIADLPSAMLDEEKLTLLAAPRTSMARNTALLNQLAHEHGGAGFWALIEKDNLICLNTVVTDAALDPGFKAGEARGLADTLIPRALSQREPAFVPEADKSRTTLLVPMHSPRGHDLGWVGLCLSPDTALPSPEAIKARIDTMAAAL